MVSSKLPKDYTVVVTEHQTEGRGQMGTAWQAEISKNLTVSVFKALRDYKIHNQFYISMVVSLAVYKTLKAFKIQNKIPAPTILRKTKAEAPILWGMMPFAMIWLAP